MQTERQVAALSHAAAGLNAAVVTLAQNKNPITTKNIVQISHETPGLFWDTPQSEFMRTDLNPMSCPAGLDKVKELAKAIGSKTDTDEEKAKAALRQAGLTPNDIKKLVSYYQAAGKQQSLTQIFLDQIDKLGLNQPDKYQVVISKYDQMMAQEVIPGLYESLG